MADIERALLSKVIAEGEFQPLIDHRITPEFFEQKDCRAVFSWVFTFWEKYGETPTFEALEAEFPNWDDARAHEPLQWYLDELRNAREYSIVHAALTDAKPLMAKMLVRDAKSILGEALAQSELEVNALRDINLNDSWEEWWQEYLNRPEGLIGIPTGFPTIDYATGGLQPEQLIALIGPPKAGKSTLALAIAKAINDYFKRPFFVSFEMSAEEQRMRYYAMVTGINYEKLIQRRLTAVEERRFEKAMRSQELMPDFIVSTDITHGTTVGALHSKIMQYKPDVVIVDGYYMMDSEVPDVPMMDTRALTALSSNLKKMAQNLRLPVVITHQALESRYSARVGLRAKDTGFTSSLQMYADVMLGIEPPSEEDENSRRMSIIIGRNVAPRSTRLLWDWETSSFTEIEDYMEQQSDLYMGEDDDDEGG